MGLKNLSENKQFSPPQPLAAEAASAIKKEAPAIVINSIDRAERFQH